MAFQDQSTPFGNTVIDYEKAGEKSPEKKNEVQITTTYLKKRSRLELEKENLKQVPEVKDQNLNKRQKQREETAAYWAKVDAFAPVVHKSRLEREKEQAHKEQMELAEAQLHQKKKELDKAVVGFD